MNNLFILCVFGFLILGLLVSLFMLINPKFFVSQTIFWNKWFLNSIGYDIEIKPRSTAEKIIRFCSCIFLFILLIVFSMGFDIFMMLFR